MNMQELIFALASQQLYVAFCGLLALGSCNTQGLLCGGTFKWQELFCINILACQVHKKTVLAKAQDMVRFIFFQYGHLL